jgi:hypothetical protein
MLSILLTLCRRQGPGNRYICGVSARGPGEKGGRRRFSAVVPAVRGHISAKTSSVLFAACKRLPGDDGARQRQEDMPLGKTGKSARSLPIMRAASGNTRQRTAAQACIGNGTSHCSKKAATVCKRTPCSHAHCAITPPWPKSNALRRASTLSRNCSAVPGF